MCCLSSLPQYKLHRQAPHPAGGPATALETSQQPLQFLTRSITHDFPHAQALASSRSCGPSCADSPVLRGSLSMIMVFRCDSVRLSFPGNGLVCALHSGWALSLQIPLAQTRDKPPAADRAGCLKQTAADHKAWPTGGG